jgi:hypothetical protein
MTPHPSAIAITYAAQRRLHGANMTTITHDFSAPADPRALPANDVDLLNGKTAALNISENMHAAYWLACGGQRDTALYLWKRAHDDFGKLARTLGYSIAPLAEGQPADPMVTRIIAEDGA